MDMMVFNRGKKYFMILILISIMVCMVYASNKNNNFIIFWDYNPELSIAYLNNASVDECSKKYKDYIKINFSEFSHFNSGSKTLVFESELDTDLLSKFENQFDHSKDGALFFSIVINDKIILNGLNRISPQFLLPSNYFVIDESDCPIMYSVKKKYLRISNVFNFDENYDNNDMDAMTTKMIQAIF